MPPTRAKAAMALPPSQHTWLAAGGDNAGQNRGDRDPVELGQDPVQRGAGAIAGDQHRDLLSRQAGLFGLVAALASSAPLCSAPSLESLFG
jgi:hypothetical protein